MSDQQRRQSERWFRAQGLPWLVHGRNTFGETLLRAAPALTALLLYDLMTTEFELLVPDSDEQFDAFLDDPLYLLLYFANFALVYLVPAVAAWQVLRWSQDRDASALSTVAVLALCLGEVIGVPVVDHLAGVADWHWSYALHGLIWDLAIIALAAAGAGAVFVWALRVAVRQLRVLGLLATRALPLLLLFVTFFFYNAEVWQITSHLPRPMLWGVLSLFATVGLLFLFAVAQDELRDLAKETGPERIPLRRRENANLVAVLALAQALQAAVFGLLVFGFFLLLGSMSIRPEVIKMWITKDPSTGKLFNVLLPVSQELVQASMFLAVFSALYFATAVFTDGKYRDAFFHPLLGQITVSLAERQKYLTRWPRRAAAR
ncbi:MULTISPECIES: hypothetical protein [unclassified Crossiella]|uniref:hypothetical protein n=1 Tax=unclassified Crossiella TaxID=2620835 RepID=UPI00200009E3|nr:MULTISPECIES: hypothetical protein [unclassified Crossiella]MCK2241448.1 hypothetical protein [Crossiella sp. S99.2]MCK2255680.1 hypothetical protein [Crossiella sp. S99.1]